MTDTHQDFEHEYTVPLTPTRENNQLSTLYDDRDIGHRDRLIETQHPLPPSSLDTISVETAMTNDNPPWTIKPFDPERDLDIAPCLVTLCGCAPCCCCLFSGIDDSSSVYSSFPRAEEEFEAKPRHNPFPINKNVLIMMVLSVLHDISESMWSGTVLVTFIFIVDHGHNAMIGFLQAIYVISSFVFSFPLSHLSEKWNKIKTVRLGGAAIILCLSFMSLIIIIAGTPKLIPYMTTSNITTNETSFSFIRRHLYNQIIDLVGQSQDPLVSTIFTNDAGAGNIWFFSVPVMIAWGLASSVISGPAQAILSSSVPKDTKGQYYVFMILLQIVSKTIGPLISLIFFAASNNEWNLFVLKLIILCG
eukprot:CAMPEP_0197837268 /NCGR_PEP_ID=MMETSP1437-20131217/31644_1 /TAXON_ID=49252 ORGANISM="Eucampia antarctica, Strain CCMP1452" /NCGR_SAMPLE_ID=MMETSP1437 /ASSEMBLY_ACC=CAM_ASM_001096 /LENGTH=360 /DNA_ID=CAMNT_0043444177 /DNA_START=77 /DNA_END=1156 /DNA_ORIENTATION=+